MAKRTTKQPKMPAKERADRDDQRVAQAVRLVREWTPTRIRQARERAEMGDLSSAVAVCEFLLQDYAVASGLGSRLDALFALMPTFEASGDKRRSNRVVKHLEAGEDWWFGLPESEQRQIKKWGLLLGIGLGRNADWRERKAHGNRYLPQLAFFHPQGLRWHNAEQRWTIRDHRGIEIDVVPGDGEWVMHCPFGKSRPWASGYWYCLAIIVLLKSYAIIDAGRASGRLSVVVGTAAIEVEDSYERRKELAESLADLIARDGNAAAFLPPGWNIDTLKISEGIADLFEKQVTIVDDAIAICLRGGNLTSNVKGGSKAATQAQAKTNEVPKLRFDAESWSTDVHDHVLEPWAFFNYGDPDLAPWPFYPTEPEEDRKARADMVVVAVDGLEKIEKQGFVVDDESFIKEYGLTFVKGRKDEATRQKEAAERFAMMQPPGSGSPPAPDNDPKADPKAPVPKKDDKAAKQTLGSGGIAMLASGDLATSAPNFLAAQLYLDDLVASAASAANVALEPFIEKILEEVEGSDSVPQMFERLRALMEGSSRQDAQELLYRVMVTAELAGRAAVIADIDA